MVDNWEEKGLPVYISVAAYLGALGPKSTKKPDSRLSEPSKVKPKPPANDKDPNIGDLNELVAMLAPTNGVLY